MSKGRQSKVNLDDQQKVFTKYAEILQNPNIKSTDPVFLTISKELDFKMTPIALYTSLKRKRHIFFENDVFLFDQQTSGESYTIESVRSSSSSSTNTLFKSKDSDLENSKLNETITFSYQMDLYDWKKIQPIYAYQKRTGTSTFKKYRTMPKFKWSNLLKISTMLKDVASLILKHTAPSRRHLTPEMVLRLVTPACPLWLAKEEDIPFKDPFWAFYWPGGQATARYILDNGETILNRRVLDIGCGCGAGSIAAVKMKALSVLANDIDIVATTAALLNAKLNEVAIKTSTKDFIGDKCEEFDTILIGDMFYDEEFANVLFDWLQSLRADGKTIYIGDPGRHGLTEKRRKHITLLAKYVLPKESCIENHGFTETSLWRLK